MLFRSFKLKAVLEIGFPLPTLLVPEPSRSTGLRFLREPLVILFKMASSNGFLGVVRTLIRERLLQIQANQRMEEALPVKIELPAIVDAQLLDQSFQRGEFPNFQVELQTTPALADWCPQIPMGTRVLHFLWLDLVFPRTVRGLSSQRLTVPAWWQLLATV